MLYVLNSMMCNRTVLIALVGNQDRIEILERQTPLSHLSHTHLRPSSPLYGDRLFDKLLNIRYFGNVLTRGAFRRKLARAPGTSGYALGFQTKQEDGSLLTLFLDPTNDDGEFGRREGAVCRAAYINERPSELEANLRNCRLELRRPGDGGDGGGGSGGGDGGEVGGKGVCAGGETKGVDTGGAGQADGAADHEGKAVADMGSFAVIVASRDIQKGEELFTWYGDEFDRSSYT